MISLIGPLIAGFAGPQGSLRRFVFGIVGALVLALNHRLGLALTLEEQGVLAGMIVTIVIGSNVKEASLTKQNAVIVQAQNAAHASVAQAQSDAVVAQAERDVAIAQAAPPPAAVAVAVAPAVAP